MYEFEVTTKDRKTTVCHTVEEVKAIGRENINYIVDNIYTMGKYIGSVDYNYNEFIETFED